MAKYNGITSNARGLERQRKIAGGGTMYRNAKTNLLIGQYTSRIDNKRKSLYQHVDESDVAFQRRFNEALLIDSKGDVAHISNVVTIDAIISGYIKQRYHDGYTSPRSYKRNIELQKQIQKTCPELVDKPITNVTVQDLQHAKGNIRVFAKSTIDKIWAMLNKAFQIAYNRRIIQYNIMLDDTLTKPISQVPLKRIEALTRQERAKFREVMSKSNRDLYKDILLLQLNTGMRIGELLARTIDDFDAKNRTLHIHNTLTMDENNKIIVSDHTKTYNRLTNVDKGDRIIPLDDESYNIIQKRIELNKKECRDKIIPYIFYDFRYNKFITHSQINSYLSRLNEKYNIAPKLTTHMLRHTRITELQEMRVNPVVIHYLVGHTPDSNITNEVYTSVTMDFVKDELDYRNNASVMQNDKNELNLSVNEVN